ncbi:MAG: acyl-CoA thioesterase [Candidatus Accumulibacter sp.]|jgi:acyl-CoA hydrolase|nr:acyl-CoA thioesterase [Accumulibacter sp.]
MSLDDRSLTVAALMLPAQANPRGNVHGGEIMKMMDNAAGCAAAKYARTNVVTARVDGMQFLEPVRISDFVTCTARVVHVGTTSMDIYVTVDVENLRSGTGKRRALESYFTLVALDENDHPTPVPPYAPETAEDKYHWEIARARRAAIRKPKP